ncbi:hypothetical protein B4166_1478 [Caldibacillus thermoamylovorans]|uniref:Uncharacterized protein n=1 Tax=Caldibacillus thermoamylovorans TaxID=35841 RepID=A0ABD4A967_9BACI|nr:hypothetical protein B4166_1478 [Caldibacillus thermoamylovorans]KIO73489.1 hypothetical protein B4167_2062 [Caldibacillus thermoamylovorans]
MVDGNTLMNKNNPVKSDSLSETNLKTDSIEYLSSFINCFVDLAISNKRSGLWTCSDLNKNS